MDSDLGTAADGVGWCANSAASTEVESIVAVTVS
jgi:hypothetical protein